LTVVSLRQTISEKFGVTDLSGGLLATLLNPFWAGRYDRFPYRTPDNRLSMRAIFQAWEWLTPLDFSKAGIYPESDSLPWTDEGQGVAVVSGYWIFSDNSSGFGVYRCPLTSDIGSSANYTFTSLDIDDFYEGASTHQGAGDGYLGKYYVAVHYSGSDVPRVVRYGQNGLGEFSCLDGCFLGDDEFQAPWVSVLADSRFIFSSEFINPPPVQPPTHVTLRVFDLDYATFDSHNSSIPECREGGASPIYALPSVPRQRFPLYASISSGRTPFISSRLQGADFAPSGHFYLISDRENQYGGGVYGFDMVTGCQMLYLDITQWNPPPLPPGVPYIPGIYVRESTGGAALRNTEYQDIEVFDTGSSSLGEFHIMTMTNDTPILGGDKQLFVHLSVTDPSKI
jgi:hypothetical protein